MGLNTIAQSTFREGHFINSEKVKKKGYFMSFGTNIPNEIKFKEQQNSKETILIKRSILSELHIEDTKFIRKDVAIEVLDDNMLAQKENNSIVFRLNSKNVLLTVLLEFNGNTLYSYQDHNNIYFFIETKAGIEFLKYKKIIKNNKQIKVNDYRKQLLGRFKIIDAKNEGIIGGIKYKEDDLVNYFLKYAKQNNFSYTKYNSYEARKFKDAINITPKIGYYFSSQSTNTNNNNFASSFQVSQISLGLDVEFFFNTVFKKSSIILSYLHYTEIDNTGVFSFGTPNDSEVINTIKMSDLNLKYRQYFRLFHNQYLYANMGVLIHNTSGKIRYTFIPTNANITDLEYGSKLTFSLGFGYNFKNIYLDLNYLPKMSWDLVSSNSSATRETWQNSRSLLNLSIGYSIF